MINILDSAFSLVSVSSFPEVEVSALTTGFSSLDSTLVSGFSLSSALVELFVEGLGVGKGPSC